MGMQQGHAEWKYSIDMRYGHVAWTCSMDLLQGAVASNAALKCTLDTQQVHAA
jgi:hypothetical protein